MGAIQPPVYWLRRILPVYAHPIYWLETFVDTSRFRGTWYRAANWQVIGTTAGPGHRAPTLEQTRPVKQMLGLPLNAKFRGDPPTMKRQRVNVNMEELDQNIERGTQAPLRRVGERKAQERAACASRDEGKTSYDRKDQNCFGAVGNARV